MEYLCSVTPLKRTLLSVEVLELQQSYVAKSSDRVVRRLSWHHQLQVTQAISSQEWRARGKIFAAKV